MLKDLRIRSLRVALVAAIAFIAGGILGFIFFANTANAHPGGMAGDGCHTHKATGTRHTHINIPGGPRVDVDCEAHKVITEGPNGVGERR